jgi:hypothetical protein
MVTGYKVIFLFQDLIFPHLSNEGPLSRFERECALGTAGLDCIADVVEKYRKRELEKISFNLKVQITC